MRTEQYICLNERITKALELGPIARSTHPAKTRSLRQHPQSPVKALTSFFSGGSAKEHKKQERSPPWKRAYNHVPEVSAYFQAQQDFQEVDSSPNQIPEESLKETLAAFMTVLRARKGNIVGRSVSERRLARSQAVDGLVASLLADPSNLEPAAREQVDVLFAAFDRFLATTWTVVFGPIADLGDSLEFTQKAGSGLPKGHHNIFVSTLDRLDSNRRFALEAVVGLLVDLLDGISNDGDRGALVSSFAEMVSADQDAGESIPLLDRLVEDYKASRKGLGIESRDGDQDVETDCVGLENVGASRGRKDSSLTKRLGLHPSTRTTEPNKIDQNFSVGNLLRSWSKNARSDAPKQSLSRVRSVELATMSELPRPSSQGSIYQNGNPVETRSIVPFHAQMHQNAPVNIPDPRRPHKPVKRRSSLSDLEKLPLPNTSPLWSTPVERRLPFESPLMGRAHVRAQTLGTQRSSVSPSEAKRQQIARQVDAPRLCYEASQDRAETVPAEAQSFLQRPYQVRDIVETLIPTPQDEGSPRGVLVERVNSGNARARPEGEILSQGKLGLARRRSQEKADNYQMALKGARQRLQPELNILFESLDRLSDASQDESFHWSERSQEVVQTCVTRARSQVSTVEDHINSEFGSLAIEMRRAAATRDMSASQAAKTLEARVRTLERQMRLKVAENEALYKRSNEDIQKIFDRIRGGSAMEEMKLILKQSHSEVSILRKENERLKRELGS